MPAEILAVAAIGVVIPFVGINLLMNTWTWLLSESSSDNINKDKDNHSKKKKHLHTINRSKSKIPSLGVLGSKALLLALLCAGFIYFASKIEIEEEFFDPFEILGVTERSSVKEIKKAYRQLALEYHPDRQISNPIKIKNIEAKFSKIAKAYEALTDPVSMENYRKYNHPDGLQRKEVSVFAGIKFDHENSIYTLMIAFTLVGIFAFGLLSCLLNIQKSSSTKDALHVDIQHFVGNFEGTSCTLPNLIKILASCPSFLQKNDKKSLLTKKFLDKSIELLLTTRENDYKQNGRDVLEFSEKNIFGLSFDDLINDLKTERKGMIENKNKKGYCIWSTILLNFLLLEIQISQNVSSFDDDNDSLKEYEIWMLSKLPALVEGFMMAAKVGENWSYIKLLIDLKVLISCNKWESSKNDPKDLKKIQEMEVIKNNWDLPNADITVEKFETFDEDYIVGGDTVTASINFTNLCKPDSKSQIEAEDIYTDTNNLLNDFSAMWYIIIGIQVPLSNNDNDKRKERPITRRRGNMVKFVGGGKITFKESIESDIVKKQYKIKAPRISGDYKVVVLLKNAIFGGLDVEKSSILKVLDEVSVEEGNNNIVDAKGNKNIVKDKITSDSDVEIDWDFEGKNKIPDHRTGNEDDNIIQVSDEAIEEKAKKITKKKKKLSAAQRRSRKK